MIASEHTPEPRLFGRPIAVALLLGLAAATTRADTMTMQFAQAGNGRMVHLTLGNLTQDIFAGRLIHQASDGTGILAPMPPSIVTFSVELLQPCTANPTSYTAVPVAFLSGDTGLTHLGFAKQQAISDIYAAADARQYTLGLNYATAFQLALWEIVYDFNPSAPNYNLDITAGNLHATAPGLPTLSTSITQKVQFLLGSIGSESCGRDIIGLSSCGYQDEIFSEDSVVPIPAAAYIGAPGLLLALAARRRLLKR